MHGEIYVDVQEVFKLHINTVEAEKAELLPGG